MKEKVNFKNIIWALIFAVFFPISVYSLSEFSLSKPLLLLIITVNALVFGVYTIKQIQTLKSLDEVQIRIQLEAVSIAFVLSLLLIMILGMVGLVKNLGLGNVSYLYIFPMLFFFYLIGLFISKRKYR